MRGRMTKQEATEGERVLNSVRRLVRALRLFDRRAQTRHGITAAQMYVLHTLQQEDGLSMNELAARTATDQSSASVVVQRLVEEGHVTRTARKADRRHVELRLTPKGRVVVRKSPPPAQQRILAAIDEMSPRDRKAFAALFEAFLERFGLPDQKAPMLFEDEPPKKQR
jgi:DNA-binding MarR family transcriptional regulator